MKSLPNSIIYGACYTKSQVSTVLEELKAYSTCIKRRVSALLLRPKEDMFIILACGINMAPPGMPKCTEQGCRIVNDQCIYPTHSEMDLLIDYHYYVRKDEILLTSHRACSSCLPNIVSFGVSNLAYINGEVDPQTLEDYSRAGLHLYRWIE